ncbi:putative Beta-hexosaminidase 3 [Cocos nucifera]|uniref:beta-N-acetylhexosaminidase n=1 Tax=Cocos nucifera TaxID=13894 RepID=A0A8K0HX91_COCNU|nr:putative Beta-hexosaminidase 3 [Cocos nucifera]
MPLGAASSGASRTLSVGFFVGILLGFCFLADGINLWPMPKSVTQGSQTLYLGRNFQLTTDGSKYSDGSGITKDAFQRMINLVEASHTIDGRVPGSGVLAGVNVVVLSSDDQLNYGIDESYKLSVPTTGNPLYAHIEVDTSRHYLPVPVIKNVIDSMTYSKLNVLHWHIVDKQSFPLEIPSYPRLWNGAYSYTERYTMADAQEIVQYAERRGINVLAEIDVPGHALSW